MTLCDDSDISAAVSSLERHRQLIESDANLNESINYFPFNQKYV
jgi:hypothetical protein